MSGRRTNCVRVSEAPETQRRDLDELRRHAACTYSPHVPAAASYVRQLEELAFELIATEPRGHAAGKARQLAQRGVRRVFAIDVTRQRAFEWSPSFDDWTILATTAVIADPALAVPLPIEAIVDAAKADLATVRASRDHEHRKAGAVPRARGHRSVARRAVRLAPRTCHHRR